MFQVDFVENYITQWQDEVQFAHCCKTQVTLMAAVYWHGKECRSAVVFDDNDHTKDSVVVSLEHLIKSLVSSDAARFHI